jgi:ketosteroid isomerase-like protein
MRRRRAVVTSGDIALLASDWRITTTTDDGEQVVSSGTSVEVARRQGNGTWRYVIDEPTFLERDRG